MGKPTEGPYIALFTDVPYAEFDGTAWTVQADIGSVCVVDCPKDEAAATARLLAKSWEMRKALKRVLSVGLDEGAGYLRQEKAADDLTQDIRALLREIDGGDE